MLFATPIPTSEEIGVIDGIDDLRRRLSYATSGPLRWTGLLRRSTFARAVRGSNSIEGYNVTLEDAIAAAEGEEPLDAEHEAWAAVVGYRNAMTYVLQLADDPHFSYSEGLLRSLHYMMLHYDLSKHPGKWRPGLIYVRNEQTGAVVYEGPDAEKVPQLMGELIDFLNKTDGTSVMVRAAMGHLNLAMTHPFSDGNGRMARGLQTLVLAREGILMPQFCSIEEYLGRNTQEYYGVLAEVGAGGWHPERDARPWVRFCLTAHFRQASTLLRRTREIQRVWDELEVEAKRRQLPERLIFALADAAFGLRVRNSTYRSAAEVSENVASRDLKLLVDAGLLIPHGERRGRSYVASELIRSIRERAREPRVHEDPFAPGSD
ncbi:MAG: Fic family protein [Candidatus Rokubacteria bacterium]|nr:Fic family protein [Candidatus Rokubacteria bacterium]MBI2555120.1 Fic family protein [Candidatus Rokubacteria bacterium]